MQNPLDISFRFGSRRPPQKEVTTGGIPAQLLTSVGAARDADGTESSQAGAIHVN